METYQILERLWADYNKLPAEGMVVCSSGTAALHLALEALQLPQGSECICPDYTMIACPRAITLAGLVPVFVDCDTKLLIEPDLINDEILAKIGCIMAVHIYGRQCQMGSIHSLIGRGHRLYGNLIYVVEDLAEAHGVQPHKSTDAACYSFYRNKIVAGEEGGAVWFKDSKHADLARQLRSLGFTDAHNFYHVPRGHNYRMSNIHASLIIDSLAKANDNLAKRRRIEQEYESVCPAEWRMPPRNAPWVYDVRPLNPKGGPLVPLAVRALNQAGIAAREGFKPCSRQEEYSKCRLVANRDGAGWTVADRAANEVLYLPIEPGEYLDKPPLKAFEIIKGVIG